MFEAERRRATQQGRWVILDVNARWGPPGLQRGLTGDELTEFGDVLVVDLDEHREDLAAIGVFCIPAKVVFTGEGPPQIAAGILSPTELRDWLTGLRANASFVTPEQDPGPRTTALLALVSAGAAEHVGAEFEAVWRSATGSYETAGFSRTLSSQVPAADRSTRRRARCRSRATLTLQSCNVTML